MTKVFISYSHQDKAFVSRLSHQLLQDGIEIWRDEDNLIVGDNIFEKVRDTINKTDYVIVVLSRNTTNSKWVNFELSATRLNEISEDRNIILPILIEDCEIPSSLKDKLYADFRQSFEQGYHILIKSLRATKTKAAHGSHQPHKKFSVQDYAIEIKNLHEAFQSRMLTLFCGAGVSYDAGIPTWNALLKSLLKAVYSDNDEIPDIDIRLATLFQKRINVSPLILAQYLKSMLGKKFHTTVRDALYTNCKDTSATIDSIAELCKVLEGGGRLRAVITFNFDDLLETKLTAEKTSHKCIYAEGERYSDHQMPIFHPHGFLPRDKRITSRNDIVFSEDAYHSQFIDPFSWSNLVQLNHLNNYTCLFVGISLTDPNMRRLLDVQMRKNGKKEKNHYIIKKRYSLEELYPDGEVKTKDRKIILILENIEEGDANDLGFNIIWINDFSEIPAILKVIAH